MTPLPAALGSNELVAWRIDHAKYASTWDSGEGAFRFGGRWNTPGRRIVYCSIDPATTILEVAVHKEFRALDTIPHVLTSLEVTDLTDVCVVKPDAVPNPNWLRPGLPSAGQQWFGDMFLRTHRFVVIPSAVSTHSWNLLFDGPAAAGAYQLRSQEVFALDTRLHPSLGG